MKMKNFFVLKASSRAGTSQIFLEYKIILAIVNLSSSLMIVAFVKNLVCFSKQELNGLIVQEKVVESQRQKKMIKEASIQY